MQRWRSTQHIWSKGIAILPITRPISRGVRAVWKQPNDRSVAGLDNRGGTWDKVIDRWVPTGEPDVDFETFKEHTW